ncbi:trypsin-like peptidase domain-containing protein [Prosthecobacter sp.]|jgi:S1-C subfamily serine protease|uniref:trypsin-like peptidase domain-containing protein n=1 Tax=Prosthecobacter sp. TaxID=1965333 RepID=UPI0031F2FAED
MSWRGLLIFSFMACGYLSAREWRSSDGSRTVEAQFAGMKDGKLLLKAKDGRSTVYPAAAFSKEDQQFAQQAQVTMEAAVKTGPLNLQVDQRLAEGSLCRVIKELPDQKGTWVAGGSPFLVLRSDDFAAERGEKVMQKVLYHAGTRTFHALDGTSSLINAYSTSLDEAVNTVLQIQMASGGDSAKPSPSVMEPVIETIITRGLGLPLGKGFFITETALLKDAKTVALHHDGKDVPAKVLKVDDKLGLALLQSEVEMGQGRFLPRKPLELGQTIYAVALTSATGKTFSPPRLTKGIVSHVSGTDSFEHDAAVDEKSVGGYVIGEKGDVLGLFFSAQSRVQGKRSATSASTAPPATKGLADCLRSEALEKLALEKDKDGKEKRVPGVPTLKSGTNGDEMEAAVDALRKSSVIVLATREESKAPPPPKAAANGTPPAGGANAPTGWSLSSSGTRHNAKCRFYKADKPCQATDGKPCQKCGG